MAMLFWFLAALLPPTIPTPAALNIPVEATLPPASLSRPAPTLRPVSTVKNEHGILPTWVLDRYNMRMLTFHTPPIMTFEYTLEQAGGHNITQTHRIYRSNLLERDETISIGENRAMKPRIRISHDRPDAYALEELAPRKDTYAFTYTGEVVEGGHTDYVYRTTPLTHSGPYSVTNLVIDGHRFLPVAIDFTALSATVTGHGRLHYADMGGGWVVSELEASATPTTAKKMLRERIVLSNYRFPKTLPASTFGIAP